MNGVLRLTVFILALATATGCRLFNKKDTDRGDPLLGKYIPKTDLPVPGRERRDPLLTQPTTNTRKPAVEKDTFRNTEATSVAGLTSRLNVDPQMLRDRRPEAKPVSRGVPLKRDPADWEPGLERYADQFEQLKARVERPTRDANGDIVVGALVRRGDASRRYEGRGGSVDAAVRDLIEQIRGDGK
jgi:hypothetical protein